MFENIVKLFRLSLIIPISNAYIERCFSSLSYIKNELRNRLLDEHLIKLIFIYLLHISQKDYEKLYLEDSIKMWVVEHKLFFPDMKK